MSHYASKLTFNAEQMVAGTLFVQTQINCPLEFKMCLLPLAHAYKILDVTDVEKRRHFC